MLDKGLKALNPKERSLFERYYHLQDNQALAAELQITPNALAVRIHAIKAKIRRRINLLDTPARGLENHSSRSLEVNPRNRAMSPVEGGRIRPAASLVNAFRRARISRQFQFQSPNTANAAHLIGDMPRRHSSSWASRSAMAGRTEFGPIIREYNRVTNSLADASPTSQWVATTRRAPAYWKRARREQPFARQICPVGGRTGARNHYVRLSLSA